MSEALLGRRGIRLCRRHEGGIKNKKENKDYQLWETYFSLELGQYEILIKHGLRSQAEFSSFVSYLTLRKLLHFLGPSFVSEKCNQS